MKSLVFAALVLSASLAMTVSGQVNSVAAANNQANSQPATTPANATRNRVLGENSEVSAATGRILKPGMPQAQARSGYNNHSQAGRLRRANTAPPLATDSTAKTSPGGLADISRVGHSGLKPAGSTTTRIALQANTTGATSAPVGTASTQVYRVGVGDVLDIQLSENPAKNSTLFTVLENGVLEYPFASNPIVVSGLTTSEIAALLRQRIKIFDNPEVTVDIRDYASHAVVISGFVTAPGKKILRREAVPLYAILAEASVLPEAARATITRRGHAPIVVDLKDANLSEMLVIPGDAIKVSGIPPAPTDFYFVGGEISSPGQKPYHAGITLTQAILASGGTKVSAGLRVRVSRQGLDGKLSTEEFNLRKIQGGKDPDPVLQKDDRVEVTTAN